MFFTPGLAIMDRATSHDRFFNSIDTTLVVPFSPHVSALGTFSLQFKDKPRWTTVGNYDWFLDRATTLRVAGGLFEDEFGARATAFQQQKHFGAGIRLGVVSSEFEVGGFVTLPLAWGFPIRKESLGERVRNRDRVTDLGAATALALSFRGSRPDLSTEPEYFYPRDAEWARGGQGPQGQSATTGGLPSGLVPAWIARTAGPVVASAAIVQDTVYVGSQDGYLYALDLETGALRWRYRIGAPISSAPAVAADKVFVGCDDGAVYCFLAEGDKRLTEERVGCQLWRFPTDGPVAGSPLVTFSGRAVFGSEDGSLYAVDGASGRKIWEFATGKPIVASPVKSENPVPVVSDKGSGTVERDVIFCASENGSLYALGERDGSVLWSFSTGAPLRTSPIVTAKKVVAVNQDGRAVALDVRNGREIWTQTLPGAPGGSPAIDEKRVIVPLVSGQLVGLSLATGDAEWSAQLPGGAESAPVAVQSAALYLGSTNGHLYAVDRSSGAIKWDFQAGGPISASPAVAHGKLVCGSRDGSVYAFAGSAPSGGVTTQVVAPEGRTAEIQPSIEPSSPKPEPLPGLAPAKRSWTPPPGWLEKPSPPSTKPEGGVIPVPKPEPISAPSAQSPEVRMRLTSEPADAAELPIDLTNERETVVAWGTTEPSADVDGELVRNQDGRIALVKSFPSDGTYPVMMTTGKGTPDEQVACRLVVVDTGPEPFARRDVAFSPDGDGLGDTIAFRVFAESAAGGIAGRLLDIRDVSGNAIRTWSAAGPGDTTFVWDGKDLAGNRVAAGMYEAIYTVKGASGEVRRMKQRVLLERAGERIAAG